jgi:transposase-like protein
MGTALRPEMQRRLRRHLKPTSDSWRVDETYIRVKGKWRYLYRAVDSTGATLDFLLSAKQDAAAAKRFLAKALAWVNRTIPRRVSSTPMGMRLTRPRSLSSRERWTPTASTGRCRTSIMSWSRTTGPSSGELTPARVSVLFGLPGARWPATRLST